MSNRTTSEKTTVDRSYSLPPLGDNPSTEKQGTTPGAFALRGRVGHTYGYPGGGRRLYELGAIFCGSRRPQQARIDLMLALGCGMGAAELRELFAS